MGPGQLMILTYLPVVHLKKKKLSIAFFQQQTNILFFYVSYLSIYLSIYAYSYLSIYLSIFV